jgi:two-component system, OmpR family, sensor histidine kinase SenX3
MRVSRRAKKIALFVTLAAFLIGLAVALNVTWIVLKWREVVPLVLGVIFFTLIIAGIVVYTVFLVREIQKNEQQDSFLNAVTHELKTPIASIRLYLETLQSRQLTDAQHQDFYRIMLEDTDRLLGTVEQILKAGEARHASSKKNWEQVDFSAIVAETVELTRLRHHLPAEALHMAAPAGDQIFLRGNPQELRTAVFNLVENAVKYSGEKKEIEVGLLSPDLDTILLRVQDKGVGIPHPELKRIFKRFYRVASSANGRVKGTGLGLFIVRSIARRHGGDAFAESEGAGRGSTFTLRLPRAYPV